MNTATNETFASISARNPFTAAAKRATARHAAYCNANEFNQSKESKAREMRLLKRAQKLFQSSLDWPMQEIERLFPR